MSNSFDPTSEFANTLLNYFSRNTAIKIEHKFMGNTLVVKSARTNNVISTVVHDKGSFIVDELFTCPDLSSAANLIAGKRNFPKPKNTKKAWSPIRLNATAQALMESDSGVRFA